MNLPENKDDRNKILLMIGIGVVAVCYVGYAFGISPLLKKKADYAKKITDLNDKLWRADMDLKKITPLTTENKKLISEIIDISENKRYIIHPNLGNYLLVASDAINQCANELGLTIDSITEIPNQKDINKDCDLANPESPHLKPYTVSVNLKCGFYDLIKLLKLIEQSNPYLTVVRLGIVGQPDDVMKHNISIDLQWPTWIDEKQPIKLIAEKMNDENHY